MTRLALLLCLSGCAHRPYYDPIGLELSPAPPPDATRTALQLALDRGTIPALTRAAGPPLNNLAELTDAEVYAAWAVSRRRFRGAEFDLRVPDRDGTVPVTAHVAPDGAIDVRAGALAMTLAPEPFTGKLTLVAGDKPFLPGEAALVYQAVAYLNDDELSVLDGLVFERAGISPRAPKRELGFYDPRFEPVRIQLFDLAFAATETFVGEPEQPSDAALFTVLHELGHALADRRSLAAWRQYRATLSLGDAAEAASAKREYRNFGRKGPTVRAFEQVRARRSGPTPFVRGSVHEAFAESFALYQLDPAALTRVSPEVASWFASGAYLAP